ncbi:MAG TPA: acetyl-CoA carboxylase carboxyltransferase subunit alpha [Chloroflexota bacterium]|nr:acetyl-CoA carboxylase carboxyltransferase subunit alpha [Chloroflexota bacterium]
MPTSLDFEAPLADLQAELDKARASAASGNREAARLATRLQAELDGKLRALYAHLTPWQKVQVARHTDRPQPLDYLRSAFSDFVELHGDRRFHDDKAMVGGPAFLDGRAVMVVGQQKGHDTRERVLRNFGMSGPEGYRKAQRLFKLAEKLGMPVITLIDTSGANVGVADEERGQAEAIASSISVLTTLRVPIISVVTGEANSGGALAIGVADRILMLEHSIYSVATPEAAAAILWRSSQRAPEAAEAMRITAQDMQRYGIIDAIVPEPIGGAQRDPGAVAQVLRDALTGTMDLLLELSIPELLETRYQRYRNLGPFVEEATG